MPAYKLVYFTVRSRGEVIRYLFAEAGVPYEDIRYSFEEWPKVKQNMVFRQLPQLEVDGRTIVQSNTIARYLAGEFGLAGQNKQEEIECDMYSATVEDIFVVLVDYFFKKESKEKADGLKTILTEKGPGFLHGFEATLSKNASGFLVGKALTYADLSLLGAVEFIEATLKEDGKALLAKFPNLQKHRKKIAALPKIAAHISKRSASPL